VQGFKVSVAEILGQPGRYRDIRLEQTVPGVEGALAVLTDDPVEASLRAEAVVEGVLVTGGLTGSMQARCARCLKDIPAEVSIDVCELYVAPGHEVPDDEDSYEVNGLEIDLEPLMRDALALALPLNPLCGADCKGLCATCGQDLNEGPCSCTEEEIDPRWAALSELRDRLA
jgi:uncharacterized protein